MRPLSSTPLDIRGMGEAAYSLPLWQQYQMRDLIAQATCDRDSLAYWSDTGRTYAVDELRRRRTRAGQLALIEEAGTRLNDRDLTTWTDNSGGSGSASATVNADGSYRITLFSGDSYGGVLRESFTALASDGAFRCEAKLVSGSTQYLSIKFGSGDPTGQSDAINSPALNSNTWAELTANPVSGRDSVEFQARGPTESGVLDNTIEIDVRFVQVEQNPYPTSWIPGPGTARAADDVTVQATALPALTTGMSWVCAIKVPAGSKTTDEQHIIRSNKTEYWMNFVIRRLSSKLRVDFGDGVNRANVAASDITEDEWNIIAATGAPGGTLRLYLNGAEIGNASLALVGAFSPGSIKVAPSFVDTFNMTAAAYVCGCQLTDAQIAAISDDILARLPA
jgi:hypothetical protein